MSLTGDPGGVVVPAQAGGLIPRGSRVNVFQEIFWVFLALGTLVGVVVTAYMLYNAYKYRADGGAGEGKVEQRPQLGELPTGGGGGRKLFLSFTLSAIIVVSLIAWTYGTLLYVEGQTGPDGGEADLTVEVEGYQFYWQFVYPNGETSDTLYVPQNQTVQVDVTSGDVFHTFGIPSQRVKADAIPGQTTTSWFLAEEEGTYVAKCYELCGSAHSQMNADVEVVSQSEFEQWYQDELGGDWNADGTDDGAANSTDDGAANGTDGADNGSATIADPAPSALAGQIAAAEAR